jgi:Sulfotransferase family
MRIVHIFGIMERSGTNHLRDLIALHPDCGIALPIAEDFLVSYSDYLVKYADAVRQEWTPGWEIEPGPEGSPSCAATSEFLLRSLGEGLERFLTAQVDGRRSPTDLHTRAGGSLYRKNPEVLVTKTPNVKGIGNFFRLFPHGQMIILVRDGRDLVESGMGSFNWDFEEAATRWASAADEIDRFSARGDGRSVIVRYEELVTSVEPTLRKVLAFLSLDPARYDYARAAEQPVRGSSSFGKKDSVSWQEVPKTPEFRPIGRWRSWDAERIKRFDAIAGQELRRLGYVD